MDSKKIYLTNFGINLKQVFTKRFFQTHLHEVTTVFNNLLLLRRCIILLDFNKKWHSFNKHTTYLLPYTSKTLIMTFPVFEMPTFCVSSAYLSTFNILLPPKYINSLLWIQVFPLSLTNAFYFRLVFMLYHVANDKIASVLCYALWDSVFYQRVCTNVLTACCLCLACTSLKDGTFGILIKFHSEKSGEPLKCMELHSKDEDTRDKLGMIPINFKPKVVSVCTIKDRHLYNIYECWQKITSWSPTKIKKKTRFGQFK